MSFIRLLVLSLLFCLSGFAELQAQSPAVETAEPSKITELLRLLDDEGVKAWLKEKQAAASDLEVKETASPIEEWESRSRARFNAVLSAVPRVSDELTRAVSAVRQDARGGGFAPTILMFGSIAAIAFGAEWFFRRSVPVAPSTNLLLKQVYTEFAALSIFTLTIAVFFVLLTWPPLLRVAVLYSLLAMIAFRAVVALCRVGLAASVLSAPSASRIRMFAAVLTVALAFSTVCEQLSVAHDVRSVLAIGFSLPLLAIVIETIWHGHSFEARSLQRRTSHAISIVSVILSGCFGAVASWRCSGSA